MSNIAEAFRKEHIVGTTRATALGFEHGRRAAILSEQPDQYVAEGVWFNEYYGGNTEYRSAYHNGFTLGWSHYNDTPAAKSVVLLRVLTTAAAGELAASILCRGFYENGVRGTWQGQLKELVTLVVTSANDNCATRRNQVCGHILNQMNAYLVTEMAESYRDYIKETDERHQ